MMLDLSNNPLIGLYKLVHKVVIILVSIFLVYIIIYINKKILFLQKKNHALYG